MPPPSNDDDLLARLNALKQSPISLDKRNTSLPFFSDAGSNDTTKTNADALALLGEGGAAGSVAGGQEGSDPILDLAARFKKLGASPSSSTRRSPGTQPQRERQPVAMGAGGEDVEIESSFPMNGGGGGGDLGDDEISLEELLAELRGGKREGWDVGKKEEESVSRLVEEMRRVLPDLVPVGDAGHEGAKGRQEKGEKSEKSEGRTVGKIAMEEEKDEKALDELDEQEADEYIASVLAELEFESQNAQSFSPPTASEDRKKMDETSPLESCRPDKSEDANNNVVSEDDPFNLPSAPTAHPTSPPNDTATTEVDDTFAARMNALSLPSAPSFLPSKKPLKVTRSASNNLPKYSDEDIESWCVICNEDAEVKCRDCDGDLYCRNCWKEGHVGPDVGYDERTHKWAPYVKKKSPQ